MKEKIDKFLAIFILLLFALCLFGCAKRPDPVGTAANAAHQQIVAMQESLPPECKTKAGEEQANALHKTIDSIVENCDVQKQSINEEKMRWKWAFLMLSIIVLVDIGRRVLK